MNSSGTKFKNEMQNNQSNWINFIHFMNYLKKKKIIPHSQLYNNKVTNKNIEKNFNHLNDKENTKKYGIVLEKKDKKYKVLIIKDNAQYMENLAIYFLKKLTQSFSGYCFFTTTSKISLHCEPNNLNKKITPKTLCIPKNNSYIKEIELEGNITIGSRLKVSSNNRITVPTNQEFKQNGGFAGAFALGIFGGMIISGFIQVIGMELEEERERREEEERERREKERKKSLFNLLKYK